MRILYSLFIHLYGLTLRASSILGHRRAKQWVEGRILKVNKSAQKCVWFHCASLGEYEQALPIIEKVRFEFPEKRIVISFFSPSGYNIVSNSNNVDEVVYFPLDTRRNAKEFIDAINPEVAIFVKYEFWFNHILELNHRKINTYFISVLFRENHFLLNPFMGRLREIVKSLDAIFVQDEASVELLKKYNFENLHLSGDTRYDRVMEIVNKAKKNEKVARFKGISKLIVVGSSWQAEEKIIRDFDGINGGNGNYKILIAPHDISEKHLQEIEEKFNDSIIRYSAYDKQEVSVLLVDNIGLLSSIYRYADMAFVGGGYSNALHNILEPAANGIPVVYGDNNSKFPEAKALELKGGGKSVSDSKQFFNYVNRLFTDKELEETVGKQSRQFIEERLGATDKIFEFIFNNKGS
ncbi:MAG: 3-deoxy-D-manno-octulosonic acid transferase [Flavobacteriales bacterium]|nr:3-deoxy-D-manno-octulosonic acid transferase [Flavobacteriales bacterium]